MYFHQLRAGQHFCKHWQYCERPFSHKHFCLWNIGREYFCVPLPQYLEPLNFYQSFQLLTNQPKLEDQISGPKSVDRKFCLKTHLAIRPNCIKRKPCYTPSSPLGPARRTPHQSFPGLVLPQRAAGTTQTDINRWLLKLLLIIIIQIQIQTVP